jgi:hypothetical protein
VLPVESTYQYSVIDRARSLLDVSPLIVAIVFAVILSVATFGLATGFPFAYALIGFVVWAAANYFVEIIERKAVDDTWAVFSIETLATAHRQLGLVVLLLLAAVGAGVWRLTIAGSTQLAWLLAGLAAICLPAALALLAVTRNPLRAVHPASLLRTMWCIGLHYVWILAALATAATLVWLAFRHRGFVEFLAAAYGVFLLAYLIGGAVYAKRDVLGVHAPRSPEAKLLKDAERLLRERRKVLDHAYGIAARGNVDGGLAYVEDCVRSEDDPLGACVWMFQEMTRWEDRRAALAFGRRLVEQLESAGRGGEAAKLKLSCEYLEAGRR